MRDTTLEAPVRGDEAEIRQVTHEVLAHLRTSFRGALGEHDFEDLLQEALAEIHSVRASGIEVREPVAFAKRVAWRRARDLVRDNHSEAKDPQADLFQLRSDERVDLEQALIIRAELARAIEAAEQLPLVEQAVYRSCFFLQRKPKETCKELGIRRREYYSALERATLSVQRSLRPERHEALQRQLLSAVMAGSASNAELRRAKRLVANDPAAAALVRELRELHQGAAALLPAPALAEAFDPSILERASQSIAWLRDRAGQSSEAPTELGAQLGASGAARAGGVGVGGVLAKLGLGGAGGKVAAGCLAAGALTVACVATGIAPFTDSGESVKPLEAPRPVERAPRAQAKSLPKPDLVERTAEKEPAQPSPKRATSASPSRARESGEADEAAPASVSPAVEPEAPPLEQEFGVPSAAPAPAPAEAPGGAASSSEVQQEFGP